MKTCQYRNHLENLQPWYWVWMRVGSPHSPGRTQAQEFTGKSQQKKSEPLPLAGTRCCPCVTNAFCSSLALIRKVLVSQLVCSCLNGSELLQCDAKKTHSIRKEKVSPFVIICEHSEREWGLGEGDAGLDLGFHSHKILKPLPTDTARLSVLEA